MKHRTGDYRGFGGSWWGRGTCKRKKSSSREVFLEPASLTQTPNPPKSFPPMPGMSAPELRNPELSYLAHC